MDPTAKIIATLGLLLLLGLATDAIARRIRLPRVTLLLVFGFVAGSGGLGLFPSGCEASFPLFANIALVMVGFLLGEKFTLSSLHKHGRYVLWISIAEVLATALVLMVGLLLIGVPARIALLLSGIAPATAPAATTDVVHEARASGRFTRTLLGIVAVDDAWGLIVFSFMVVAARAVGGQGANVQFLLAGAWEVGGAVLLGIGLGVPMAYLTGRIRPGVPTLTEALGFVFVCGGIAIWMRVSFLLASMVLGAVVANLARHHTRPFHAIEGIEWPFMILFFVLAGASLRLESLPQIGLLGIAYVILRVAGRFLGAWLGGLASHADALLRRWMGMALMPQAGVALGMALVAKQQFPELAEIILPVVIGATVLFELFGPVLTRTALVRVGEARIDR